MNSNHWPVFFSPATVAVFVRAQMARLETTSVVAELDKSIDNLHQTLATFKEAEYSRYRANVQGGGLESP